MSVNLICQNPALIKIHIGSEHLQASIVARLSAYLEVFISSNITKEIPYLIIRRKLLFSNIDFTINTCGSI